MLNKYLFILPILICVSIIADAQYNQVYNSYLLHQTLINPATSGSEYFPVINLSHSRQWLGIPNSPNQQMISGSFRIGNFDFYNPKMYVNKKKLNSQERLGAGFVLYNDNEGPVSNRGGKLSYAYHIPVGRTQLSLGISAGFFQFSLNEKNFSPIQHADPLLHYGIENYYRFNSSFGALYYSEDYFVGISVTEMIPLKNKMNPEERIEQDFHLIGGYRVDFSKNLTFEPSVYINYLDYYSINYQINTRFYYKYVNWINLFFHSKGDLGIKVGIKMYRLHIAYGYSASLSRVALYNLGTHEINIGMNIGIRRIEVF